MDLDLLQIPDERSTSKVRCKCGNDAIIRTVKNGPNCGSKFYGCPLWPVSLGCSRLKDTTCDMFLLIEGKSEVEELQWKMFEKDTTITKLEMLNTMKDEKIKNLQMKKKSLEEEMKGVKNELGQQQIALMRCSWNNNMFKMTLICSWYFFAIVYYLK
ncbi:DNA topoisomerase 3-alpha [Bienertia sinuspersici]